MSFDSGMGGRMKHAVKHIHFVEGPRAPTKDRARREAIA